MPRSNRSRPGQRRSRFATRERPEPATFMHERRGKAPRSWSAISLMPSIPIFPPSGCSRGRSALPLRAAPSSCSTPESRGAVMSGWRTRRRSGRARSNRCPPPRLRPPAVKATTEWEKVHASGNRVLISTAPVLALVRRNLVASGGGGGTSLDRYHGPGGDGLPHQVRPARAADPRARALSSSGRITPAGTSTSGSRSILPRRERCSPETRRTWKSPGISPGGSIRSIGP